MIHRRYEDDSPRPQIGAMVSFHINKFQKDEYRGKGRYAGESALGLHVDVTECTKPENVGQNIVAFQIVS